MPVPPHERPLTETLVGWEGRCLAKRCTGKRRPGAWGSDDGLSQQVVTECATCGRIEVEPAPGFEHPALPGME